MCDEKCFVKRALSEVTIEFTNRPRQHRQMYIIPDRRETPIIIQQQNKCQLIASTDKQTVNDHDKCYHLAKTLITYPKNKLFSSEIIFNHGFNGPPLTFRIFSTIYLSDLDSTSGTLKCKHWHVITEHKTTHFWRAAKKLFLGVIQKFLYGHITKEPYFQTIINALVFGSVLNTKTALTKKHANFDSQN